MSTDIGVVRGLIELQDDFTSQIGLAEAALSQFTKKNQESLVAVGAAVGLVTASFVAAAAAVYNLGQRGADIVDVEEALSHFSGTSAAAAANLDSLRKGTLDTVDDFDLMKEASHLLSAGVKLNAEDFATLGSAAFLLQNRGLGGTKEMLDLVSDAMVTGRTKTLQMAIGVVNVDAAEAAYAKTLGLMVDELTDAEKVEARRIAIMAKLKDAVKDAGAQHRDFGEQIEFAKAQMTNWLDQFAKAIATSPALAAAMQSIQDAIMEAFGGDSTETIASVMEVIKSGVIVTVDFGIAVVEMARVVNRAWNFVKAEVLAVYTVATMLVQGIVEGLTLVAQAGAALNIIPDSVVKTLEDARTEIRAMAADMGKQTEEAGRAVLGYSEFETTLDKVGGTLFNVRDAVMAADASQKENNATVDIAAANAKKLADMQAELTKEHGNRAKIEASLWKIEEKSLTETTVLWNEYFALRVQHGGSALSAQKAQIEEWFNNEVAKLDAADRNWKNHYDALKAVADEKLNGISADWDFMSHNSLKAMREQLEVAQNTYNEMARSADGFTREQLEAQRQKIIALQDAARGYGADFVAAEEAAAAALQKTNQKLAEQKKAAEDARAANLALGGTSEVNAANFKMMGEGYFTQFGISKNQVQMLLEKGFSYANAFAILQSGMDWKQWKGERGPRVPGFADGVRDFEGGPAWVGERGPEIVNLPKGASVTPVNMGGGGTVHNWYINGSGADVARQVKQLIMRELKSGHQFGSA